MGVISAVPAFRERHPKHIVYNMPQVYEKCKSFYFSFFPSLPAPLSPFQEKRENFFIYLCLPVSGTEPLFFAGEQHIFAYLIAVGFSCEMAFKLFCHVGRHAVPLILFASCDVS